MGVKLHEIELNAKDPEASKKFYNELLGLPITRDQEGLKVFDSGRPGLDVDASVHNAGKVSISFLVADLGKFVEELRGKGVEVEDPSEAHLGMRAVTLEDPDGYLIQIQSPTAASPDWLKSMVQ